MVNRNRENGVIESVFIFLTLINTAFNPTTVNPQPSRVNIVNHISNCVMLYSMKPVTFAVL